jgi:transcriptional regulator with XRE-family HTH domain
MDAEKLRAWRARMDLTDEQLAMLFDVSPKVVRRWETGEVPIPYPNILALALKAIEQEVDEQGQKR